MYATHNMFQCVTLILGRYLITSFLRAIERGHPEATAPGYLLCLPVDDTSHDIISKLELLSKIENSRHPYDDTCCGRLCNCCGNDGMCQGKKGNIFFFTQPFLKHIYLFAKIVLMIWEYMYLLCLK